MTIREARPTLVASACDGNYEVESIRFFLNRSYYSEGNFNAKEKIKNNITRIEDDFHKLKFLPGFPRPLSSNRDPNGLRNPSPEQSQDKIE